jgi:hypothetical protein
VREQLRTDSSRAHGRKESNKSNVLEDLTPLARPLLSGLARTAKVPLEQTPETSTIALSPLAACDADLSPTGGSSRLEHTLSALTDDEGDDGFDLDNPPAPNPHGQVEDKFIAAKKALGFTNSDPATWSTTKKTEICELYANELAHYYKTRHALQPAFEACMTGKEVDLGMWSYQTVEMLTAGFFPTDPETWSTERRREICEVPFDIAFPALTQVYPTSTATWMAKALQLWCETHGVVGPWSMTHEPPTGWKYAQWEFLWWKKQGFIDWGENSEDQTPFELPK